MTTTLQYGSDSAVTLDIAPESLVATCGVPRHAAIDDPVAAVVTTLQNPLELPPLTQFTVPGDHIVLALEDSLPLVGEIVAGVVQTLMQAGVEPRDITIVRNRLDAHRSPHLPTSRLCTEVRRSVQIETHDPKDRRALSYLAAASDDQPIYINRTICDADVVLPIGAVRPSSSLGYLGVHGGWFPTFADLNTQKRFHSAGSSLAPSRQQKFIEQAEEAAWLLGIQLVLQVVPGAGDELLHVLAGSAAAVHERGSTLCDNAWKFPIPRRASLVVAAIGGGRRRQTWQNLAGTLATALAAVEEEGSIAIASDLRARPGPALRRVADAENLEDAWRCLRHRTTADVVAAKQLVSALQRVKVYLLSGLDEQLVEDLGMIYVSAAKEIATLSRNHPSCIVLANAQRAAVALLDEATHA